MVVRTQASLCGLVIPKPGQRMAERAKDCRMQHRRIVSTFEPPRNSVDWAERDIDLCQHVGDAASTLFQASGKPVRVTQIAIFRLLKDSGNLYRNRNKLPATVRSINKAVESEEQFGHRLLRYSVTDHASDCLPLARRRLDRAVGVRRLKRFPSLRNRFAFIRSSGCSRDRAAPGVCLRENSGSGPQARVSLPQRVRFADSRA
jgi:hypothetical protein